MKKKIIIILILIEVISLSLSITKKELKEDKVNSKKLAVFLKQEDGSYKQSGKIPGLGYTLNTTKSTCSNGAVPTWNSATQTLDLANLTSNNTNCYLYFDTKEITSEDTVARLNILNVKEQTDIVPDFSKTAATDEGVYKVEDGMYGGYSYYWRGAATTNYVKFANFCWRIIRINGDGSIRLIYDGTVCHANETNTTDSIAVKSQKYNVSYSKSEYIGYTYTEGSQRPADSTIGTASNLKMQTETWFNTNITDINIDKVAEGKFCNDRNTGYEYIWNLTPSNTFYYAAYERLTTNNKTPTLSCDNKDIYILKVGAITADEVSMAGGVWLTDINSYYLYNGQNYWTMSPRGWNSSGNAIMFYVNANGSLTNNKVSNAYGIRPVINLRSDVTFQDGGNGTQNNPYIVSD